MKSVHFTLLLFLVVSCGKEESKIDSKITQVFSDSAVTSFEQTSGLARTNRFEFLELLIPSSYAVSGNISCNVNDPVSFEATALSNVIEIDTTCNSNIDLNIRRNLLESLAGKTMLLEKSGGANQLSNNITMTLASIGTFWDIAVPNIKRPSDASGCRDKYNFNLATGKVTISLDAGASAGNGETLQDCYNSEFVGATAQQYVHEMAFRFKDGKVEFDPFGTDFEENNDFQRWCLDSSPTDGACD